MCARACIQSMCDFSTPNFFFFYVCVCVCVCVLCVCVVCVCVCVCVVQGRRYIQKIGQLFRKHVAFYIYFQALLVSMYGLILSLCFQVSYHLCGVNL